MTKRYALPGWKVRLLAPAPDISQMLFVYDTLEADPTLIGAAFPNLEHAGFLLSWPKFRSDTLSVELAPPPQGWSVFGLTGTRPGRDVEIGNLQLGAIAWFLLFEWNPVRSAWDALLVGQDALRPQRTSLTPEFVLPTMFLARMAHFPLERGVQSVPAAWVHCFAQAQMRLLPLITGLFKEWRGGPSSAAKRYRSLSQSPLLPLQQEEEEALSQWQEVFGDAMLDQVHAAERLEPTIMRGLDATSTRLWADATLNFGYPHTQLIEALLPISQWQPSPPGPERLYPENISSLEVLQKVWNRWRTK
jgi:hypothetical protein